MASRSRKKWEKPRHAAPVEAAAEAPKVPVPAAPEPSPRPRRGFWSVHGPLLAALWVCSLIPYLNSFRDGFAFDNALAIVFDARVHADTPANIHTILTTDYWHNTASSGLYRPLTTLSYLFNYAILGNGTHPAGYHIFNSVLQAINVALVYFLGFAIFEAVAPAFALALLWSVHPVLTESVTNIVGRADQLAALATLAALLFHIRAGASAGLRKLPWLAATAMVVAIGMFSKESAIVVLAMMFLYDVAFSAKGGWLSRVWGYVAAVIPVLVYLDVRAAVFRQTNPGQFPVVDNPLVNASFWPARITAMRVLGKYLWMYLWPAHLSADYSYNQIPAMVEWKGILSLVVCLAAAAGAIVCLRRSERVYKAIFFFVALFFVAIAPTSNVFMLIGTVMAERFLYLPSIGLAGCIVIGIFAAARRVAPVRSQTLATAVIAMLSLAFAVRTYARNFDWHDNLSLTIASVKGAPNSFKVHMGMAHDELEQAKPDLNLAISEAERSMAIVSDLSDVDSTCRPYQVAGEAYRRKGDSLPEGPGRQQWYHKALDVLLRGKKIDLLDKDIVTQLDLAHGFKVMSVGWEALYLELGRVYERLGESDKALEVLRYGCSIKPNAHFYEEISRAYRLKGDNQQAEVALMEGLVNDPSVTLFASELVELYTKAEPQSCAVRRGATGASLDLACPLVHQELCAGAVNVVRMYAQSGRRDQAVGSARTAIQEMACPAEMFR